MISLNIGSARSKILPALFACLLAPVPLQAQHHAGPAKGHSWSYEGSSGPEHWGDLKAEFATCKAGREQSPIDIPAVMKVGKVEPIGFDYRPSPLRIVNNGHTIQVDYAAGSSIQIGADRYELLQFHFHTPSEERVQGRAYDMVAHLVHRDAQGRLAVVAVLLTRGARNAVVESLWEHLPQHAGEEKSPSAVTIDVAQLLPSEREYYAFSGSLTTPPCSEGVRWNVLSTPVEISDAQFRAFTKLFPNNARPVQPLHGRTIRKVR